MMSGTGKCINKFWNYVNHDKFLKVLNPRFYELGERSFRLH